MSMLNRVALVVFLIFASLAVSLRVFYPPLLFDAEAHAFLFPLVRVMEATARFEEPIPLGLRVGTAWLFTALKAAFGFAGGFFFVAPEDSAHFLGSPWPIHAVATETLSGIVALLAAYCTMLLLLAPVYIYCTRTFRSLPLRLMVLVTVLVAFGGWHPVLVNLIFAAGQLLADWPRAYYLFSQFLIPADVASVGFLFALALCLACRGWQSRLVPIAATAAVGQFFFENLGLVTGLSAFGYHALGDGDLRGRLAYGAKAFVAAGFASAAVFVLLILLVHFRGRAGGTGVPTNVVDYLAIRWLEQGQYNFAWFNVTLANLAALLALPLFFGAVLGIWKGLRNQAEHGILDEQSSMTRATLAVALGFFTSLAIGMFNSGYGSDMGRQALPLVTLSVPLAVLTTAAVVRALISRLNPAR